MPALHIHRLAVLLACSLFAHAVATSAQTVTSPSSATRDPAAATGDAALVAAPQLVIDTTAPCTLKINGATDDRVLMPDAPRRLDVAPGDATIECTSTTSPGAIVRQSMTIARSSRPVNLMLDVASAIVKASCTNQPHTLVDLGHGVLRHCVSGVDWTQSDAGTSGLFWPQAFEYCARKGKGWVLPELDEMAELIDRISRSQTPCGIHTCYVSSKFRLSSPLFWSNLKTHEGMHMIVNLILGGRHPTADDENHDYHTLCVRRPTGAS